MGSLSNPLAKISTQGLLENLKSEGYVCYDNFASYISENPNFRDSDRLESPPSVIFSHPKFIEGCEFSSILILWDASSAGTFTFANYNSSYIFSRRNFFLTAITRASFKVTVIVEHFEIPSEDFIKKVLAEVQRRKIASVVDEIDDSSCETPTVLFVGSLPESSKKVEQNCVPGVEGISKYSIGPKHFLFVEDIYLKTDLMKLQQFGSFRIIMTNKNVSCIWHYYYLALSTICVNEFTDKNSGIFYEGCFLNSGLMQYQQKFHLAILRQYSNDLSNVDHFNPWAEFDSFSQPSNEIISWEKWESKAKELLEIKEIARAAFAYECSFRTLETEIKRTGFSEYLANGQWRSS